MLIGFDNDSHLFFGSATTLKLIYNFQFSSAPFLRVPVQEHGDHRTAFHGDVGGEAQLRGEDVLEDEIQLATVRASVTVSDLGVNTFMSLCTDTGSRTCMM